MRHRARQLRTLSHVGKQQIYVEAAYVVEGNTLVLAASWLIDQLIYSRDHRPALTHYVTTVRKKDWSRS